MKRALLLAAVAMLVGCGPDGPDAALPATGTIERTTPAPPAIDPAADPAAVASATCDALRELDNEIIAVANRSSSGINDVAAAERMSRLLAAVDDVEEIVAGWPARIEQLDIPAEVHGDELRQQLASGVPAALAELADQRAEFVAADPVVPDDELRGVFGVWFNAVEKVLSVLEPEIFRLDDPTVEQAFLDEPACRNVIQMYVVD